MNPCVIRRLLADDAAAYHALRLEMLRTAPSSFITSLDEVCMLPVESVLSALGFGDGTAENIMLGAFLPDGKLVGSAGLSRSRRRNERHRATVVSTYVEPGHTGRGVATVLMRQLIATAMAQPELEQLHLTVTATNAPAVKLYRKLGFIECGLEPAAIKIEDAHHDKLHMHLLLPASRPKSE
jgi:hypothetical protein